LPFCDSHIANPIVAAAPNRATAIVIIVGVGLMRFITKCIRANELPLGREPRQSIPSLCLLSEQRNARRPEKLSRRPSRLPDVRNSVTMQQRLHWLDYDPVAFAVLAVGMGMIALLALSI
jgi:hypothetical protein